MSRITLRSILIVLLSGAIFVFTFPAMGAIILPSGFGIPFILFLLYGIITRVLFEVLANSRPARSSLRACLRALFILYFPLLAAIWIFSLAGFLLLVSWPVVLAGTFLSLLVSICVLLIV